MAIINVYIDLLTRRAVRGPTSAAPAPRLDFRDPAAHTLNLFFLRRQNNTSELYNFTRFSSGTPVVKLRRQKPPDFCMFVLSFSGSDSIAIDASLGNDSLADIIGGMLSVGANNVNVTGNVNDGWNIEFIGDHAGYVQPSMTGRIVTPSNGEIVITEVQAGGNGVNEIQSVRVRDGALASAGAWTELTAGSNWGWTATLDTSAVLPTLWDYGDMSLEVGMGNQGVRTGTDGVTALEGTTRSGSDGVVVALAVESGVTALPVQDISNIASLVASQNNTIYGRLFKQSDIGRTVGANAIFTGGSFIASVIDLPYYNAAVLNQPFASAPVGAITYNLGAVPSEIYKSATAAFVASDVGHLLTGANLGSGIVIQSVLAADTVILVSAPSAIGTALAWTLTAIPGNTFGSASAAFIAADVGAQIEAPQLRPGTIIASVVSGTSVTLSDKAIGVASGQSWTIRRRANFAPPTTASITPGTLTSSETQQLSLTQAPIGGYITLQDGADASLPVVQVVAPIVRGSIERALNAAYSNYGGIIATEQIPGGQWTITWGIKGKQWLLTVNDSNAVYDTKAIVMPVGDQPIIEPPGPDPVLPSLVVVNRFNLNLMGVTGLNWKKELQEGIVTQLNDGTGAFMLRRFYAVVLDQPYDLTVGTPDFANASFHLDRIENIQQDGGIRKYEAVFYNLPAGRVEYQGDNTSFYKVWRHFVFTFLVDIQLESASNSTWIQIAYSYFQGVLAAPPSDGIWGTVLHFQAAGPDPAFEQIDPPTFNGTYGIVRIEGFSRRLWHADYYEQQTRVAH